MEPCYEYLGCDKEDCIMRELKDTIKCWEIEGTKCNHPGIELVRKVVDGSKKDVCEYAGCIYYREAKKNGLV